MSWFAHNLELLRSLNNLKQQDVNRMFGWGPNAYHHYMSKEGATPETENWQLLIEKTGIPQSDWIHTRMTEYDMPRLKFVQQRDEERADALAEDQAQYGPLVKVDLTGLLDKLYDLEQRLSALEEKEIAKE